MASTRFILQRPPAREVEGSISAKEAKRHSEKSISRVAMAPCYRRAGRDINRVEITSAPKPGKSPHLKMLLTFIGRRNDTLRAAEKYSSQLPILYLERTYGSQPGIFGSPHRPVE